MRLSCLSRTMVDPPIVNSHVMLGAGQPVAVHIKENVLPSKTVVLVGPWTTGGTVGERY